MKKSYALIGIIVVIVLCVMWAVGAYNGMVRSQETASKAWADVQSTYQRRADLIPNLVETVKGYAKHEQQVFEGLRHLKEVPANATVEQLNEASTTQEQAVRGLFALGEAYPELKSAEIFNNLIDKLSEQSQQYSAARRAVNGNITKLNTYVVTFPSSIACSMKGVTKMDYIHEENIGEIKDVDLTMNI